MKYFFIFVNLLICIAASAQDNKMLYSNCSEVYDKGDTTICIEQFSDTHQLIRYYLCGNNLFSQEYTLNSNGEYAFEQVVGNIGSAKNGFAYYFYKNNQAKKTLIFSHNLLMNCTAQFDMNGNALPIGTLKDGNGTLFVYDENGVKKNTLYYKKGKKKRFGKFIK